MKRISFSLIALAILGIVFSCQKEVEDPQDIVEPAGQTTVITAGLDGTKTALQDAGKVYWTSGDVICVNGTNSDALSLAEPAAKADFNFASSLADEKKAVYPASIWTSDGTVTLPATQNLGTAASFATDAVPMVAYTASGNSLSFKHAVAIIKVQLKIGSDDDEISYVEFSGNNDEQISGAFSVNYSTGVLTSASAADPDKKVQVTVNESLTSTALPIFIAVPAGSYSNGFTIKVVDENSHVMTRKTTGSITLAAGHIYPMKADTFDQDGTLKAWAKSFVRGLDVWEATVGNVDADSKHNGSKGYKDVHYIPIGNSNNSDYKTQGNNQYDDGLDPWGFSVGATSYTSSQAWEIAIRGLLKMCIAEGEEFLGTMNSRNKAYTLQDNAAFTTSIPSASASNKWGKNPWYEEDASYKLVKDNGAVISSVGVEFMIKVGAWHVVRSFIYNATSNTSPLGMVGNFQQFGTSSGTLNLGNYSGYISPMRELLILMRIYKYLLDNNINENIYTAIQDQTFDFDLYGNPNYN